MAKTGSERLKAYREKTTNERLEIIVSSELKQSFKNIPDLENFTNGDKLKALIDCWLNVHNKKTYPEQKEDPVNIDWNKFDKDFNNFLDNYKASNLTRTGLRKQSKQIKEALESNPEYSNAFKTICERLTNSTLKLFKPMFLQGYFYLYSKEIIEISQQKTADNIILLLFEALKRMGKDDPVMEAKKILGLL